MDATPIRAVSPVRQPDDMRMRRLSDKTHAYVRAVRQLAAFLGRPPDTRRREDLRGHRQAHTTRFGSSDSQSFPNQV
jgi:hypothetical protein